MWNPGGDGSRTWVGRRSLRISELCLPLWKVSCQGAEGTPRKAKLAGTREAERKGAGF